eukprot:jgi/Mesvir1/2301/Mv19335-RA.1
MLPTNDVYAFAPASIVLITDMLSDLSVCGPPSITGEETAAIVDRSMAFCDKALTLWESGPSTSASAAGFEALEKFILQLLESVESDAYPQGPASNLPGSALSQLRAMCRTRRLRWVLLHAVTSHLLAHVPWLLSLRGSACPGATGTAMDVGRVYRATFPMLQLISFTFQDPVGGLVPHHDGDQLDAWLPHYLELHQVAARCPTSSLVVTYIMRLTASILHHASVVSGCHSRSHYTVLSHLLEGG